MGAREDSEDERGGVLVRRRHNNHLSVKKINYFYRAL